jgi:hypothetical protein
MSRKANGYRPIINENLDEALPNDGLRRFKNISVVDSTLITGLELLQSFSFFSFLVYSAAALIYSLRGCKLQAAHTDFPEETGSWSMIMCLKDGTKFVIYGSSKGLFEIPIIIHLKFGETVFFADYIIHSGSSYFDENNYRFFMYFDKFGTEYSKRTPGNVYYP